MANSPQQVDIAHSPTKTRWSRQTLAALLWIVFIAGLLTEVLSPRLKIENHAFVMRSVLTSQGGAIRPDAIVDHERRLQWVSGILALGGSLSLGFWYRRRPADALTLRRNFHPQSR
jgi:hypothetical protein